MNDNITSERNVDVLVIGGGGSGLVAGLRAKENGAENVAIIERNKKPGGTALFPAGFLAVQSPAQKRMGIKDDVDDVWLDHMNKADWNCDGKLVRKWFKESGRMVGWLEEKGMRIDEVIEFSGVRRLYHRMLGDKETGYYLVKCITQACNEAGVDIICSARAHSLITNGNGDVSGAIASSGDTELRFNAKKVIISTGSISGNNELVRRLYHDYNLDSIKTQSNMPFNKGDGFLMVEKIGGAAGKIIPLFLGPNNHPNNIHVGLLVRRPHVMTVNREGERYTDEAIHATHKFGCIAGTTLQLQPGHVCFPIVDHALLKSMIESRENVSGLEDIQGRLKNHDVLVLNNEDTDRGKKIGDGIGELGKGEWLAYLEEGIHSEAEAGRAVVTDNFDDIADFIGCERGKLKAEINRYNQFCVNKYDDDFLKDSKWLFPVKTPPYYCFRAKQGVDTCMGGILVNHNQEVLDNEHYVIKNLYATGVGNSGFLGNSYAFCGTEFGYTLYSGWAAGRNAAKAINN